MAGKMRAPRASHDHEAVLEVHPLHERKDTRVIPCSMLDLVHFIRTSPQMVYGVKFTVQRNKNGANVHFPKSGDHNARAFLRSMCDTQHPDRDVLLCISTKDYHAQTHALLRTRFTNVEQFDDETFIIFGSQREKEKFFLCVHGFVRPWHNTGLITAVVDTTAETSDERERKRAERGNAAVVAASPTNRR